MKKKPLKAAFLSLLISIPAVFIVWFFIILVFIETPHMDTGLTNQNKLAEVILGAIGALTVIAVALKEYRRNK